MTNLINLSNSSVPVLNIISKTTKFHASLLSANIDLKMFFNIRFASFIVKFKVTDLNIIESLWTIHVGVQFCIGIQFPSNQFLLTSELNVSRGRKINKYIIKE